MMEQAAAAEPEQPYIPMSDEDYQKVVTSYAMGRTTKSGGDIRAAWMAVTHAGKKELAAFDLEVARIRKAMAQAQAPADEL